MDVGDTHLLVFRVNSCTLTVTSYSKNFAEENIAISLKIKDLIVEISQFHLRAAFSN